MHTLQKTVLTNGDLEQIVGGMYYPSDDFGPQNVIFPIFCPYPEQPTSTGPYGGDPNPANPYGLGY